MHGRVPCQFATQLNPSRAFPKFKSYDGMLETAASVGWKVKDAIVGFHGIGRLVTTGGGASALWSARGNRHPLHRPRHAGNLIYIKGRT